jgi:hypothetical protein
VHTGEWTLTASAIWEQYYDAGTLMEG